MKTFLSPILIFLIFTLINCSGLTTKKHVVVTKRKPLYSKPAAIETPQTSPSTPLVADGITKLKEQKLSEAEWSFEEAINLDPDYGPAYYWLARAKYKLEEIQDALHLLEKAEGLMKQSAVWLERIQKFKEFLLDQ